MNIHNIEFNIHVSGTGRPFIWSHGLTGSMASDEISPWIKWDRLTDILHVIRYDVRGHGKSTASYMPSDYHWSALSRDMLSLADALGFEKLVVGGGSMGAATALYAALSNPSRIDGLVLLTPPTIWEIRSEQANNYTNMANFIESEGIEAFAALMEQPNPSPNWQSFVYPDSMRYYLNYIRSFDPKVLATLYRGAHLSNLPPAIELKTLVVPTLILAWTDDPVHPIRSAESLYDHLPNAQLVIAHNADEVATWTDTIRIFVSNLNYMNS